MNALDPCPRCRGVCKAVRGPVPDRWGVKCLECDLWADDRCNTEAEAIAAWNRRAALPARGVGVDIEDMARTIYDAMRFDRKDKTPEWVNGGNSHAQVEARAAAARILAAPAPTDAAQAREAALREAIDRLRKVPLQEVVSDPALILANARAIAVLEAMLGQDTGKDTAHQRLVEWLRAGPDDVSISFAVKGPNGVLSVNYEKPKVAAEVIDEWRKR